MNSEQPVKTILILAANPQGTPPLRLDEEVREIKAGLRRSRHRDRFVVEYESAARPRDVRRAMLDYKPQIVHFCGHGEGERGLVLENEQGQPHLVSTTALTELFKLFAEKIDCVLLNACYSEVQARTIAQHIRAVIGMNQPIGDRAAIEFAIGFYDALGAGESVQFAFAMGRNAMQLEGIAEDQTPVLLSQSAGGEVAMSDAGAVNEREGSRKLTPIEVSAPENEAEGSSIAGRSRIFISYKRGVEPDEPLAMAIYQALSAEHDVFIDQTMLVGSLWADQIKTEIRRSDFLITLLSAHAVQSEMVVGEVKLAHDLMQEQGKPKILPIRVMYREPFAYPLSAYLNQINWTVWNSESNTERLLQELQRSIVGQSLLITSEQQAEQTIPIASAIPQPLPSAQPVFLKPLEMPEGTMAQESQFYVARSGDAIALETIGQAGVTITIKAPRQMGKSSLLIRTMAAARQAGKQVAFLDFQLFDKTALTDGDRFFPQFCAWLTDELELADRVEEYWSSPLGNSQRCTRYMQRYLLKEVGKPLVLAMDEVESVFDTPFRSDFFSMLRSWHNNRATTPIWKRLDLALVTSTEPYQLIADLNQSPFNVGQVIELSDFSPEQVADLNQRHGDPLSPAQLQQLMALLNGHPYLVRRALYLVARGQLSVSELFSEAVTDRGVCKIFCVRG